MRVKLTLLCIIVLMTVGAVFAQEDNSGETYRLVSIEPVTNQGLYGEYAVLSPDGQKIAYADAAGICIFYFDMDTEVPLCSEVNQSAINLKWSPDSRYVAFNQDFFRRFDESDLWVLDVESLQLYNLTDDGTVNFDLSSNDGITDVLPIWAPDGTLYFFRYAYVESLDRIGAMLYRFSFADGVPTGTEPELVHDFSDMEEDSYSFFNLSNNTMSGAFAFSPDGSKLAFMLHPHTVDDPNHGLWLLDMESGESAQIVTQTTMPGLPEWFEARGFMLDNVAWSADGESLIVTGQNENMGAPTLWNIWFTVDATDGTVQQFFDLSGYEDRTSLFLNGDGDTPPPSTVIPRTGVYIAEDDVFVGIHTIMNAPTLYETHVDDLAQYVLADRETFEASGGRPQSLEFASYGIDGDTIRVLLWQNIITLERNS